MAVSQRAAEDPQQRVLCLPELRVEILEHLDPRWLYAAARVNRAWAATALPLLWRRPPRKALHVVPAKRCHVYDAAIRHVAVMVDQKRQMKKAWTLPRLRELSLIYYHLASNSMPAMLAFVSRHAAQLSRLTIWCDSLARAGEVRDCVECRTESASVELLQEIVRCRGLVSLTLGFLLTDRAIRTVHADPANPFERLRELHVHVEPKALPTLCGMIRDVTHLGLQIGLHALVADQRKPGIFSTVSRLRNLRALAIGGCYESECEDFWLLGRLKRLQKLKTDMGFEDSVSRLAALLTKLPQLQNLQITCYGAPLSSVAYHVAADNCPELEYLALPAKLRLPSPEAEANGPHFPKLKELQVCEIEVDGGLERYASSLSLLTRLSVHNSWHDLIELQGTDR
jgi:hypothetical protein